MVSIGENGDVTWRLFEGRQLISDEQENIDDETLDRKLLASHVEKEVPCPDGTQVIRGPGE